MNIDSDPEIRKVDGRSKEARAARAAQATQGDADARLAAAPGRAASRQPARQTATHDPIRQPARNGVVLGRDGEVLSRTRTETGDPYHIPEHIVPTGWSYQWNVVTVYNSQDQCMSQTMGMFENGWRPVPAERHDGMFVPRGTKGEILRGGQRLEERPATLTAQAKAEDVMKAKRQISDRNESLMLEVKKGMKNGMEMGKKYRGTGGDMSMRMSIDPTLDIPAPQHQLAEPGE